MRVHKSSLAGRLVLALTVFGVLGNPAVSYAAPAYGTALPGGRAALGHADDEP